MTRSKTPAKKPKAKPGRPKTRKPQRPKPDPSRLTRTAIARLMNCHHSLLVGYLAKPGAPRPDEFLRYDRAEVEAFIKANASWALSATNEKTKELKDEKLALEVASLRRAAAIEAGELVPKAEVFEALEEIVVELEGIYRQKFEHELPPKYQGKNEAERRELNIAALAECARTFKSGKARAEAQIGRVA